MPLYSSTQRSPQRGRFGLGAGAMNASPPAGMYGSGMPARSSFLTQRPSDIAINKLDGIIDQLRASPRQSVRNQAMASISPTAAQPPSYLGSVRSQASGILGGGMAPPGPAKTPFMSASQKRMLQAAPSQGSYSSPGLVQGTGAPGIGPLHAPAGEQRIGIPGFNRGFGGRSRFFGGASVDNGRVSVTALPGNRLALSGGGVDQTADDLAQGVKFRADAAAKRTGRMSNADKEHATTMSALKQAMLQHHMAHAATLKPAEAASYLQGLMAQMEADRQPRLGGKAKASKQVASNDKVLIPPWSESPGGMAFGELGKDWNNMAPLRKRQPK